MVRFINSPAVNSLVGEFVVNRKYNVLFIGYQITYEGFSKVSGLFIIITVGYKIRLLQLAL